MDEIYFSEAVFRVIRDQRHAVQDLLISDNVKNKEQYLKLMDNLK